MRKQPRSSIAEAYQWVSTVITITLEMVLPAYVGTLLDKRWETGSALTLTGAGIGMAVAISHLLSITSKKPKKRDRPTKNKPPE